MSDAQKITLLVDGEETKVTTGTTGAELFFERRDVVVARVNGELKDLDQPLPEDATVEGVTIDSPDGLNVLRHSTAHVMAQAVQQLRPDAKLGIGAYITDGFYFDFEAEAPGPLLTHTTEVVDALAGLDRVTAEHSGRYDAFRERFASLEDGRAAARFVDRFLTGGA